MTSPLKFSGTTIIVIDNYDEGTREEVQLQEFLAEAAQTPQEMYHLLSYKQMQAVVWVLFKNFSESKDPLLLQRIVMALVGYNQSLHLQRGGEDICSVVSDEFLQQVNRPTVNLPILLQSKIKSRFLSNSFYLKNNFREWGDTLVVFSKLARNVSKNSIGTMLVECYNTYKNQHVLTDSATVDILFCLAEISCILTEEFPEFSFEDKSISHMVRLIQEPNFPQSDAVKALSQCFYQNSRRNTCFVESMFYKGPIIPFLECAQNHHYIRYLERLLLDQSQLMYTESNAEKIQKVFASLLVASFANDNQTAFNLLLYMLPHCAPYITGVYVDALKAALVSSKANVCQNVSNVMSSFTGKTELAWDMVNHVLQQMQDLRIDRPIVMLNKAIEQWNVVLPRASALAGVVRIFARYSTEQNIHQIFAKLVKDDEDLCRKDMTRIAFVQPKFVMSTLLAFLQLSHPELSGREPSWIETLEGEELNAFIEIAQSIRLRKDVRKSLYFYLVRDDASEKSLYIATRIAHCFGARQVVKLATKLSQKLLDVLVAHDFSENVRNALFFYFCEHKDSSQLLYASRIYKALDFAKVEQLIERLDASTPSEFLVTDIHKSVLKSVISSRWIKETDSTLQSADDARIKEFIGKMMALLKKFWLEDEIPRQNIDTRLTQMITGVH